MLNYPFFSIIVPVYNVEKYLDVCLSSIVTQEYIDFELICINDGSTDTSLLKLKEYEKKYDSVIVLDQKNQGMSVARNAGIQIARGKYVLFVDSDDFLKSNALKILSNECSDNDIITFNTEVFVESTREVIPNMNIVSECEMNGWDYFNQYALRNSEVHFVCVWQRAYKRAFLLENKLFFKEGISRAEDNLFTILACYYAKSVKIITKTLYVYRKRADSITYTPSWDRILQTFEVNNILLDFFIPIKNIKKKVINKVLVSTFINAYSLNLHEIYGNRDNEIPLYIDFKKIHKLRIDKRQLFLCYLIRISPSLFRFYIKINSLTHKA